MTYTTTALVRLVLVLALAAVLAPAALANHGAITNTYAPQPLDAQRISPYARVSRGAIEPKVRHATVVSRSSDGFDWGDAGIGAGATFLFSLCVAPLLLVRQAGRRKLVRT